MNSTAEILIGIAIMHLAAFGAACGLISIMWRNDGHPGGEHHGEDEGGGGGGGGIRKLGPKPTLGGPPLLDATPANVRFRGPARLGGGRSGRPRRPSHDRPRQPVRS